ncbi:YraN family protein [Panacagrimonas perspica]|nr:YraN family protein [Panacagrimonas perspica]
MSSHRRRAPFRQRQPAVNGASAEDLALRFLEARGLKLIDRNVRARGGELDLVMRDADALVIIEVRKRSNANFGTAAETVDARKQAKVVVAARALLAQRPDLARLPARFDVVALDASDRIEWIQAAFDASD